MNNLLHSPLYSLSNIVPVASLALVLSAGMTLSACGGGDSSAPAATSTTTTVTTAATTTTTTNSGSSSVTTLQVADTVTGPGAVAAAGNTLSVNYTGYLYDAHAAGFRGAKFDSSLDRGQPFSFKLGVGQVIAGWDQGIAGMRVGGKRTLIIPSSLAYGAQSVGTIPPNSALVFDVELLSVN